MHYMSTDVGSCLAARYATAGVDITAGASASDGVEVNGEWIDRQGFNSVKVVIVYTTTLAATKTLSIAANLQDATDSSGSGANDFGTAYSSTVVATGESGGTTEKGVVEFDFNLLTADRYIRIQFTPDLSAANTDTAEIAAVYVLGGGVENPVTASVV
jgi:hypothetical protein